MFCSRFGRIIISPLVQQENAIYTISTESAIESIIQHSQSSARLNLMYISFP